MGLKKRDGKIIYVTPEQEEFMRENYKTMTHEKIGEAIGLTSVTVARYCCNNGFIKMKVERVGTIPRIIPDDPRPKIKRPPAVYNNPSREQHVEKYLTGQVEDKVLPIKRLTGSQMTYIIAHYERHTTKQMAEHLKVDELYVRLFCQKNGFEAYSKKGRKTQKKAA